MNEIYIHDKYPVHLFREFIQTLETNELNINNDNYQYYYGLNSKYEFETLQKELDKYCEERPDINRIVGEYTQVNDNDKIDEKKEELLSSHLDVCLSNDNKLYFPLSVILRILNAQTKLNDHQLLIKFIYKLIEKRNKTELTD